MKGNKLAVAILSLGVFISAASVTAWLLTPPRSLPPPSNQLINVDCILLTEVSAWQDVNHNGQRDPRELPLAGVRFELDEPARGRQNVGVPSVSACDGLAHVRKDLPGCPDVEFDIRAIAPPGYIATTPSTVVATQDPVAFGFARSRSK